MLVGGLRISEKNIDIIYLIHGVLKNEIFGLWKIYIFPWYLLLQFENLFVLTLWQWRQGVWFKEADKILKT